MLAPLEDRSLLERDEGDAQRDAPLDAPSDELAADAAADAGQLPAELTALRESLRESRQSQRRSAARSARQVVAQANEILRLETVNEQLRQRLLEHESGLVITGLGQQLMALRAANEQLSAAATRVWTLDKTLCAAHRECETLARERDSALCRLRTATREPAD